MDALDSSENQSSGMTMFETLARKNGEPLEVGDLDLHPEGNIYPRPGDQPMVFQFVYEGVHFDAELAADRAGPLTLKADLGVLPYSAETPFGRRAVLTLIREGAPAYGEFELDQNSRVRITLSAPTQRPRTPVFVMATIAALLIDANPYIQVMRAAGALRSAA